MTVKDILVHLEKCGPERILEVVKEPTLEYLPHAIPAQPQWGVINPIGIGNLAGTAQQTGSYIQYAQYADRQQIQNWNR